VVLTPHPPLRPLGHNANPRNEAQDMVLSALKTNRQSMARAGALDVERPVCPLRTGLIWRGSGDKVAWIERPAQRV
jgi:hypothetical protein